MKHKNREAYEEVFEAHYERGEGNFASADACSHNAQEVIEAFDEQLAAFGLEVVQYETGADHYFWAIEKRGEQ